MEPFRQFLVHLYWDGNVSYMNGNVTYDDNTKQSSIVIRERISYEQFVNICYNLVRVDRNIYNLSIILLYQFEGLDFMSEIRCDNSLETLYYLASRDTHYRGHVWIKQEHIFQVQPPQQFVMQGFQQFVNANEAGGSGYAHQDNYAPPQNDDPTTRSINAERTATVGGFEDLSEDCSSEHSVDDQDSSPVVSDDDDNSDDIEEEYVADTIPTTQPAIMSTLDLNQDLPDWAEDEELDMWSASSDAIRCGMCFKSKKELDHAVRLWNVARGREIIIMDSNTTLYKARCYSRHMDNRPMSEEPECRWIVRASKKKNTQLWQIYKWVDAHNCYGTVVRNNNRSLKSNVIATHISHFITQDVSYPVKHVQAHIKNVLNVDVSYQKAWHGRRKAIEAIYGSWESNFEELPTYIAALEQSNPTTIVQWKHHDNSSSHSALFKYVFWAFGPSIKAFQRCHPVMCVDGTHLKGSYRGKMLTAVTKDANNHILPIAYAIVDEETIESWSWFFQMFRLYVANTSDRPLCVISDRHQGIINAMETLEGWMEPRAYHRYCLRHVRSNLMSRFKIFRLKKLCWVMGSTTQRRKYKVNLREMKQINLEAWHYLKSIGTGKWSLVHDNHHRRWGNLTTNIAESMNNVLKVARLLPIKACIDHTFNKTVEHFRKHSEIAMNCSTPLPPRMWRLFTVRERHAQEHTITEFNHIEEIYRVVSKVTTNDSGGNDYTVEYKQRKCTCGKWQMTRFPCSHAIAVCRYRGQDVHTIIHQVYKTSTYRRQYTCDFSPLPHKDYWPDASWKICGDSSRISTARGRRRARRIHNEMDVRYPDEPRIRKCTICKQPGHTRTRCPNTQPSYD